MAALSIKKLDISNIGDAKEIWRKSFIDDNEYLSSFFKYCYPHIDTYGLTDSTGSILSIASIIKSEFSDIELAYLYGVATPPEHRGHGYSRILFNEIRNICSKRYDGIITRPAEESLFKFYESLGFTLPLIRNHRLSLLDTKGFPNHGKKFKIITSENFGKNLDIIGKTAEKICRSEQKLRFSKQEVCAYAITDLIKSGYMLLFLDGNYLIGKYEECRNNFIIADSNVAAENEFIATALNTKKDVVFVKSAITGPAKEIENSAVETEIYGLCMPFSGNGKLNRFLESKDSALPPLIFLME